TTVTPTTPSRVKPMAKLRGERMPEAPIRGGVAGGSRTVPDTLSRCFGPWQAPPRPAWADFRRPRGVHGGLMADDRWPGGDPGSRRCETGCVRPRPLVSDLRFRTAIREGAVHWALRPGRVVITSGAGRSGGPGRALGMGGQRMDPSPSPLSS